MNLDTVVETIYLVLKECVDNIILPTGKTLLPSLKISIIILLISLVSSFFNLFTFISWQGAAIGVVCLLGLCFIERREENEISRQYRDVQLRVGRIKSRATRAGTGEQNDGVTDDNSEHSEENRRGDGESVSVNTHGFTPSDRSGSGDEKRSLSERQYEVDISERSYGAESNGSEDSL